MQPNFLDMFHGDNRELVPNFVDLATAKIYGVMHKASQGTHYSDARFASRRQPALDAGLLYGGYAFLDSTSGKDQADKFLNSAKPSGNFCCGADFEKWAGSHASLETLVDFISYVDANAPAGTECVLYGSDLVRELIRPQVAGQQSTSLKDFQAFFQQRRLWLAEYGPHENIPWPWKLTSKQAWGWQYSATGREPGVVGAVDLNYFPGSAEELALRWLNDGRAVSPKKMAALAADTIDTGDVKVDGSLVAAVADAASSNVANTG